MCVCVCVPMAEKSEAGLLLPPAENPCPPPVPASEASLHLSGLALVFRRHTCDSILHITDQFELALAREKNQRVMSGHREGESRSDLIGPRLRAR